MSGQTAGEPTFVVATAAQMHALGQALGAAARAGDLIVLTGGLGAGKTTLTQGIGRGLAVRGQVVSPTFTIVREYPSTIGGPALVHVDMYRLGGLEELDALDLDSSLDRLEVEIRRTEGALPQPATSLPAQGEEADPRTVTLHPVGPRWQKADWAGVAHAVGAA